MFVIRVVSNMKRKVHWITTCAGSAWVRSDSDVNIVTTGPSDTIVSKSICKESIESEHSISIVIWKIRAFKLKIEKERQKNWIVKSSWERCLNKCLKQMQRLIFFTKPSSEIWLIKSKNASPKRWTVSWSIHRILFVQFLCFSCYYLNIKRLLSLNRIGTFPFISVSIF